MQYAFGGSPRTINTVTWFLGESAPIKLLMFEILHDRVIQNIDSESESPAFKFRFQYLLAE